MIAVLILVGAALRFFNLAGDLRSLENSQTSSNYQKLSQQSPVDINRASQSELQAIPGIGKVIAGRIIAYRSQYGFFKTSEDLKKVKGIGSKKLKVISGYISF